MNLRQELGRLNEWTVPDHLYDAWRILFEAYDPPDKKEILAQAYADLKEEELLRKIRNFDRDRRQMPRCVKLKYNWSNK